MITAVFTDNSDYARATGLWQWNYGQKLRIEGLRLPTAVEIHFALTEFAGDAITRVGTTKDGVTLIVRASAGFCAGAKLFHLGKIFYWYFYTLYIATSQRRQSGKQHYLQITATMPALLASGSGITGRN